MTDKRTPDKDEVSVSKERKPETIEVSDSKERKPETIEVGDSKEIDSGMVKGSDSITDNLDVCDSSMEADVSPGTQMRHIVEDIEAKVESISKHLVEDSTHDPESYKQDCVLYSDVKSDYVRDLDYEEKSKQEAEIVTEKRRSVMDLVKKHESIVSQSSIDKEKHVDTTKEKTETYPIKAEPTDQRDIEAADKNVIESQEQHALFEIEVTNYEVAQSFDKTEDEKVEAVPWTTEPSEELIQEDHSIKDKPCHYAEETVASEVAEDATVDNLESEEPCKLPSPLQQEYPICTAVEQEVIKEGSYDKPAEIEDVCVEHVEVKPETDSEILAVATETNQTEKVTDIKETETECSKDTIDAINSAVSIDNQFEITVQEEEGGRVKLAGDEYTSEVVPEVEKEVIDTSTVEISDNVTEKQIEMTVGEREDGRVKLADDEYKTEVVQDITHDEFKTVETAVQEKEDGRVKLADHEYLSEVVPEIEKEVIDTSTIEISETLKENQIEDKEDGRVKLADDEFKTGVVQEIEQEEVETVETAVEEKEDGRVKLADDELKYEVVQEIEQKVIDTSAVEISDTHIENQIEIPIKEKEDGRVKLADDETKSEEIEQVEFEIVGSDDQKAKECIDTSTVEIYDTEMETVTEMKETMVTVSEVVAEDVNQSESTIQDSREDELDSKDHEIEDTTVRKTGHVVIKNIEIEEDLVETEEFQQTSIQTDFKTEDNLLETTRESESPVSDEDLVEKPTHVSRESSLDADDVLKDTETKPVEHEDQEPEVDKDTFATDIDLNLDDKKASKIYKPKVLLSRQESNIEIILDECGDRTHDSDEAEHIEETKHDKVDENVEHGVCNKVDESIEPENDKPSLETTEKETFDTVEQNCEPTIFCEKEMSETEPEVKEQIIEDKIFTEKKGQEPVEIEEQKETMPSPIAENEIESVDAPITTEDKVPTPSEDAPMEETQLHGHVYSDILLAADEEMSGEPLGFSVEPSSDNENEYLEPNEDTVTFGLAGEPETCRPMDEEYAAGPTATVIEVIEGDDIEGPVPPSPSTISETVVIDTSEMMKETTSDYDLALTYVDRVEHSMDVQRKPSITSIKSEDVEPDAIKEPIIETSDETFVPDISEQLEAELEVVSECYYEVDEFDEKFIDRTEQFLELNKEDVEVLSKDNKKEINLGMNVPSKNEDIHSQSQPGEFSSFSAEDKLSAFPTAPGGVKDSDKTDSDSVDDEEIDSMIEQKSKASVDADKQSIKSSERPLSPSDFTLEMEMDENGIRPTTAYVDDEDYDEEDRDDEPDDEPVDTEDPMSADVSQQIFIEQTIEQKKIAIPRHTLEGDEKTDEIPASPSEYTLVTSYDQEKLKQVLETPEKKVPQVIRIAREEGLSVSMDESVLQKELGIERNIMSASYDEEAIKYVYDEEDIMVSSVEHVMQDSLIASSIEPDEILRITGSVCSGRDDDISSSEHKSLTDSLDQDSLQRSIGSARGSGLTDSMDFEMIQRSFSREDEMMAGSLDPEMLQRSLSSVRDDIMTGSMDSEGLRRSFGLDKQDMTDSLEQDQLQRCLDVVTEEIPLTTSLDDELMEKTLGFKQTQMDSSGSQDGLKVAVGVDKTADIMTASLEFDDLDALHRSLGLAPSESLDSSSKASEATHEPESSEVSEAMLESMDDDAFRMSLNLNRQDPMAMSMDSEALTRSFETEKQNVMSSSMDHAAMKASLGFDKISSDSEEETESEKYPRHVDPMMMSMDEATLQTSLGLDKFDGDKIDEVISPVSHSETRSNVIEEIDTVENDLKFETTADTVTTEDTNAMKESLEEYSDDVLDTTTNGDSPDAAPALHDTGTFEFLIHYLVILFLFFQRFIEVD